jgi:predicted metalloprotease with PDZ domain
MSNAEIDRAGSKTVSKAHQYRICPTDPAAHVYEVSLTVHDPDPAGQVFTMPAWIPGSYMIRDFAKHVVAIRAESDGVNVPLLKLDKSRWQAAATRRPLTVTIQVYALDESVRGAHLDMTHGYFNGSCVFLSVVGQEDTRCDVEIVPPPEPIGANWRVGTSMRSAGAERYGFGTYTASDYAELIDHPVEMGALTIGEFEANGIPHAIVIRGSTRTDMARLCHDLQVVCEKHLSLLGAPDDLDRYVFLLHAPGQGYGGLEHGWSSSLVCARDSLPQRGEKSISDGYRTFLGLVSHEYFHLWNVKRLKPAAFTPYDLAAETHTQLLWVFEGITSYFDDLALVRSGLITDDSYLELLGRTITRVLRGAGRLKQSVAESSFDAWTKFYKPDANAANSIVSYYAKGSLIALALDLKLRADTDGKVSLDTVMQACWQRWGQAGGGMPEDGFETVCAEVAGADLGDFFDSAVRGTGELPLRVLLAGHGVRYQLRRPGGRDDKGGTPGGASEVNALWLGAEMSDSNGKLVFATIANGGPAEAAGVAPGDIAVALDGLSLTTANWHRRLHTYHDGDALDLVVFRGDQLLTMTIRPIAAPENTCFLQFESDIDVDTQERRSAWLHGD